LLFQLGAERYAIDVKQVARVIPLVRIKRIPRAPAEVAGALDYRGAPVPVIDLCQLALGHAAPKRLSTRIMLVPYADRRGVERLLKERMGLDAASIGSNAIARAVRERATALGLPEPEYWTRVSACEEELQQLIDAVVVPETWFFRDRELYPALIELVRSRW